MSRFWSAKAQSGPSDSRTTRCTPGRRSPIAASTGPLSSTNPVASTPTLRPAGAPSPAGSTAADRMAVSSLRMVRATGTRRAPAGVRLTRREVRSSSTTSSLPSSRRRTSDSDDWASPRVAAARPKWRVSASPTNTRSSWWVGQRPSPSRRSSRVHDRRSVATPERTRAPLPGGSGCPRRQEGGYAACVYPPCAIGAHPLTPESALGAGRAAHEHGSGTGPYVRRSSSSIQTVRHPIAAQRAAGP